MKNKAFSLLEIMVVVVIVGVLAGMAVPQYLKTVEIQKVRIVEQQFEQIATAFELIAQNNKSYDPCPDGLSCRTEDEINARLELDIHNEDFGLMICKFFPDTWKTHLLVTRILGNRPYVLKYYFDREGVICYDFAANSRCPWFGLTQAGNPNDHP